MAKHTVTLIPGDGIGPEISSAMCRVVEATGVDIEWESVEAGADVVEKYGTPLPDHVLDSVRKNKVAIKGPITTPVGTGFRSVNVALRKELDLYACLRPSFSIQGTGARYDDVDLVIVRENTEDLYAGIEFEEGSESARRLIEFAAAEGAGIIRPDSGISLKPISVTCTRRIVKFAFDYAIANGRKKVTAVHKANILKHSDGLFLRVARDVAEEYRDSGIEFEDYIVDATCMQLVLHPEWWDVLVLPNLYGDILSDLAAGLIGGLGMAPGANIGADYAVFEPTHGSAPKYVGLDKVNPIASILAGKMMLEWLGERKHDTKLIDAAREVEDAVAAIVAEGTARTYDMGGSTKTSEMAQAVAAKLK